MLRPFMFRRFFVFTLPVLLLLSSFEASAANRRRRVKPKATVPAVSAKEDSNQDEESAEASAEDAVENSTKYFEDMPGETVSGTPRLIRANPSTEIFFNKLNQSYVIPKDSKHNPLYYAFEAAMKEQRAISFRVDPYSRRVLFVDGVAGASSKKKPKLKNTPAAPVLDGGLSGGHAKDGSQ